VSSYLYEHLRPHRELLAQCVGVSSESSSQAMNYVDAKED